MPGGGKKNNNNKNNKETGGQAFKFEFGAPGSSGPAIKTEKDEKPQKQNPLAGLSDKERAAAQAALLPILQKKFGALVGKSSGYFETLPKPVQNRVKVLKTLQHKKDEIDAEYKKELAALEEKFRNKKKPLFERRTAIVTGTSEVTSDELAEVEKQEKEKKEKEEKKEGEVKEEKSEAKEVKKEEKSEEKPKSDIPEDAKGIPGFWLEVLKHYDEFGQMIVPEDEEVLKSLRDVTVRYLEEKEVPTPSFAIDFHFDTNAYFENTVLSKIYHLEENEALGEVMFDSVEGTEIKWKSGKKLTVKLVTKQQKTKGGGGKRGGRGGGQTKTVTVEEPCESFFNFFNPDLLGDMIEGETDEEYEDEMQMAYESDYDLGMTLKTQILPNAVLWYTGEAEEVFGFGEEDGEDEEEEGEGEEGDEEYNSEEDEDFHPPPAEQQGDQPKCENQVQ